MTTLTHGMTNDRYHELRRILEERREEMAGEVKDKIRLVRTEGGQTSTRRVADITENSEADIQDDIEFALIQMKAETLTKISAALARLEELTVEAAGEVCSTKYDPASEEGRRLRRIADHVRACTFAIHENVYPGPNKEK